MKRTLNTLSFFISLFAALIGQVKSELELPSSLAQKIKPMLNTERAGENRLGDPRSGDQDSRNSPKEVSQ